MSVRKPYHGGELAVQKRANETERVKSFRFRSTDGKELPAFQPGHIYNLR